MTVVLYKERQVTNCCSFWPSLVEAGSNAFRKLAAATDDALAEAVAGRPRRSSQRQLAGWSGSRRPGAFTRSRPC